MVGKAATRLDDQGPLMVVRSVVGQLDKGSNVQSYLVKLLVEGEEVTLHFYNTTHSVNLQGNEMMKTFSQKVFLPFLEANSNLHAIRIKSINEQMRQGGRRGQKRPTNPASNKTKFTPKSKRAQMETELEESEHEDGMEDVIPQSDQQLGDSILLLSTLHPPAMIGSPLSSLELEEFPTEMFEEMHPTSTPNPTPPVSPSQQAGTSQRPALAPPPTLLRLPVPLCPEAAEYTQRAPLAPSAPPINLTASQRLILPDVFDVESDDEYRPLEALQLPNTLQGAVPVSTRTLSPSQDLQLQTLETWAALEVPGGAAVAANQLASLPTSEPPASPLDSSLTHQLPDLTQLPGPQYASVGDYMVFICESVKSQSEIIMRLEENGRRQNMLIHKLSDKVELLSKHRPLPEGWEPVTQPTRLSTAAQPSTQLTAQPSAQLPSQPPVQPAAQPLGSSTTKQVNQPPPCSPAIQSVPHPASPVQLPASSPAPVPASQEEEEEEGQEPAPGRLHGAQRRDSQGREAGRRLPARARPVRPGSQARQGLRGRLLGEPPGALQEQQPEEQGAGDHQEEEGQDRPRRVGGIGDRYHKSEGAVPRRHEQAQL